MSTAHARVEALEVISRLWPAVERAGGGRPLAILVLDEAEILPRASRQRDGFAKVLLALRGFGRLGIRGENLARVPRAERVVEQEVHHVVLGEQLRHGRQLVGAD